MTARNWKDPEGAQRLFAAMWEEPRRDDPTYCAAPREARGDDPEIALRVAKYAIGILFVAMSALLVFLLIFGGVLG